MDSLRIAFATPEYVTEEYFDGGLGNYVHRVAKALAAMGHEIHVLTLSEIAEGHFQHEGVTVHRIKSSNWWLQLDRATRSPLPSTLGFLDFSLKVYRKLKSLDSQQPLQLVQFPNYSACGLFSILFLRVPHVLRASSYQPAWNEAIGVTRTLDSRLARLFESFQFRRSPYVFAPSHKLQGMLTSEAGLAHVRVVRSPFYVETSDWDNRVFEQHLEGKKYLLFFGRFQLHKGFHTLAEALPEFFARYPDAFVALVGRDMETSLGQSMTEYARSRCRSFTDRLVVLPKLPHRTLYPVIAGARLVVLPSLIENLPNAGLEAMGLGKVVIGTRGSSLDELITDGVTGFLVPPNDSQALANKINFAWDHPGLDELGAAARQRMLEFSPDKTVAALLSYYGEILNG